MADAKLSMWNWHRNDYYTVSGALEDKYPQLLAKDAILHTAMCQIRVAELAIDKRMEQLREESDDVPTDEG